MAQTTTTDIPTIGEVILAWRKFRELSSTELADKAGVRIGYLSTIEHNKTVNPWPEHLEKLADALGVPLLDIHARRMPPKKKGRKRLKRATGPTLSPKQPAAPQPTIAGPSLALPDKLFGSAREEFKDLIASAYLTDEEEEKVFSVFVEIAKPILALIKPHYEKKEG
jgi:transcriptional regulator with XRE-family HTH domain